MTPASQQDEGAAWSVVTGAGGGIGLEIVRLFAGRGPVLAIDRDGEAIREALAGIGDGNDRITPALADVSSDQDVKRAFRSLPDGATIGCLVNCAAIFDHRPAATMSLDAWERVLKVNLTGPFLCSQAAFPRMRSGSVIINIGSINGYRAIPTHANYAVSKAGLMMLTQCLAVEWASHGIRVVSLSPGIVDTPMNRRVEEQAGINPADVQAKLPLRRYASPEEIARIVAFLASDVAGYVSGTDLLVDGAWTALGAS
jgi:NAD(P)-dependent dehydrogenase (short-subunit alcohol dehydrogenase family)